MSAISSMVYPYRLMDAADTYDSKPEHEQVEDVSVSGDADELLSPCSSILTLDNPVEFNPIEFDDLLTRRTRLYRSGTLTEEINEAQNTMNLSPSTNTNTNTCESISRTSTLTPIEDVSIKFLSSNEDHFSIKVSELLRFINNHTSTPLQYGNLTMIHLLIYCSEVLAKPISTLKVCHLGKCFMVQNDQDLTKKKCELFTLKVDKYPTVHLTFSDHIDLNMSTKDMVSKTFDTGYYPVTYADVIVHKISSSQVKTQLKKLKIKRSSLKFLFKQHS